MRGKEEAHDYRYFPDPDLLPLEVDEAWVETIRESLPELPADRKRRFVDRFGLSGADAEFLTGSRELADYFEACLAAFGNPKLATNWVAGPLMALLNAEGKGVDKSPISPEALAELLKLLDEGVISGKIAKTVFDEMVLSGRPAKQIVEEKGLVQVQDASAIESVVDKVLSANPSEVEAYKGGKTKLMGFFVGQVMRETKGKANPKIVNELLGKKLKN
jgi:aspartyl-tRNA(Asn)/glutamyl-tRNA(Gln) amidotransferase subunit B